MLLKQHCSITLATTQQGKSDSLSWRISWTNLRLLYCCHSGPQLQTLIKSLADRNHFGQFQSSLWHFHKLATRGKLWWLGHCVLKWGFTRTFPGNQDATLKLECATWLPETREPKKKPRESRHRPGQVWDFQISGFPTPTQRGLERHFFSGIF